MLMRGTQSALGEYTNPQVQVVEAAFEAIEKNAEDMADLGPVLIEPTLASLTGDTDEPFLVILLENVQKMREDLGVFATVGNFFKKLNWLFGMLPVVLMGLALFVFFKAARPTLKEIVALPEKAVSGRRGVVKDTVKLTLRNIWAETKATFGVIGVLLVLTALGGFLLGYVLEPAMEVFLGYLMVSFLYVQVTAKASSFLILFSLMGSIVFLVLNLAVIIAATVLYLGKAQKIFQRKFREGVPLASHGRFWKWGTLGVVWAMALPLLYILAAEPAIGWLVERSVDKFLDQRSPAESSWGMILAPGPLLFIAGLALSFWLARGVRALGFIAGYDVAGEEWAQYVAAEQAFETAARQSL
jgi:hypothetical protein